MKIPKFSILVANYNNGKYLMDAINSVLRQTYSDWEIVIVDDCSTDESQILYENLKTDARIRIFYNPQNMGCGYTKNRCVMEARGEWCGNRKILICAIIRIINNLLLYGFPVIMPLYLCTTHNGGINIFKTEEWMRIWGFVFVVTLIFNTFWGWFMDRFAQHSTHAIVNRKHRRC